MQIKFNYILCTKNLHFLKYSFSSNSINNKLFQCNHSQTKYLHILNKKQKTTHTKNKNKNTQIQTRKAKIVLASLGRRTVKPRNGVKIKQQN